MQLMMELREDHNKIRSLLIILQNKLAAMDAGSAPNFSLIADVVDYFVDYAYEYHHPREEAIYTYLRLRYPLTQRVLKPHEQDHRCLREMTQALADSVSQVMVDVPLAIAPFAKQLSRFISKQREHLEWEENKAFPLFEQTLGQKDWQELERQLSDRVAPQFVGAQTSHYRELYEALIEDLA